MIVACFRRVMDARDNIDVADCFVPPSSLIILAFAPSFANVSAMRSVLVKRHQNLPLGNLPREKGAFHSLALAFCRINSQLLQLAISLALRRLQARGDAPSERFSACALAVFLSARAVPRNESQMNCNEDAPAMNEVGRRFEFQLTINWRAGLRMVEFVGRLARRPGRPREPDNFRPIRK